MRYDDKEVEKDVIDETESINLVTTLIQLLRLFTLKIQFEKSIQRYEIWNTAIKRGWEIKRLRILSIEHDRGGLFFPPVVFLKFVVWARH